MTRNSLHLKFETSHERKRKLSFLDDCYFSSHSMDTLTKGSVGHDACTIVDRDAHSPPRRVLLMQVLQAQIRGKFNQGWINALADAYICSPDNYRIGELYNFTQSPIAAGVGRGHPFDLPLINLSAKFTSCLDFSSTDKLLSGNCSGHIAVHDTATAAIIHDSVCARMRELREDRDDDNSLTKNCFGMRYEVNISPGLRVMLPMDHASAMGREERELLSGICREGMTSSLLPQASLLTKQRVEEVQWNPLQHDQIFVVSSTSHCLQLYSLNAAITASSPHESIPQARCFSQRRGMQDFCVVDDNRILAAGCDGAVHLFDARCAKGVSSTLAQSIFPGTKGDGCLYSIACAPDARYAYAGSASGGLHCWDLRKMGKEKVNAFTLGSSRNKGSMGRPSLLTGKIMGEKAKHEANTVHTVGFRSSAVHRLRFNPTNHAQLAFQQKNGTSGALHVSPSEILDVDHDTVLTHLWVPRKDETIVTQNTVLFKDTVLSANTSNASSDRFNSSTCDSFIRKPCFSFLSSRFLIGETMAWTDCERIGMSSSAVMALDFDGNSSNLSFPRRDSVRNEKNADISARINVSASPVCIASNPRADYLAVGMTDGSISLIAS